MCRKKSKPIPLFWDAFYNTWNISHSEWVLINPCKDCPHSRLQSSKFPMTNPGRAFEIALNKEDLPALGNPTNPNPTISFNSNKKLAVIPGLPILQNLGP